MIYLFNHALPLTLAWYGYDLKGDNFDSVTGAYTVTQKRVSDLTYSGYTFKVRPVLKSSAFSQPVPKLEEEAGKRTEQMGDATLMRNANKA